MELKSFDLSNDNIVRSIILSDSGNIYETCIDLDDNSFLCSCPYHVYNKVACKHIYFLYEQLKELGVKKMSNKEFEKLETGCKTIDLLLGGGLPYGIVTSVVSEPNIGKTKLGLQCALANIAKGYKSLIIDTEGEKFEDHLAIMTKFGKRWNLSEDDIKKNIIWISAKGDLNELSIEKLLKLFGYKLTLELSSNGKYSVTFEDLVEVIKEGRKIKSRKKLLPIKEYMDNVRYILIDSITMPLKESVGSETQNLPARASIVQRLYGRLYQIAKEYNAAILVTHHASVNPITPYGRDFGHMYGGHPVLYNSKYAIQLLDSTSEIKKTKFKGFEHEARRVRLIRHPYINDTKLYDIRLKTDYGFCDI